MAAHPRSGLVVAARRQPLCLHVQLAGVARLERKCRPRLARLSSISRGHMGCVSGTGILQSNDPKRWAR